MTDALRYIGAAFALLAAVCSGGCSGSDDDPDVPEGTLRITADKTSIKADGADAVTFRVMYGSADVSRSQEMTLVRTINDQHTELSGGVNTFTATTPGQYTFQARYKDGGKVVDSENSVAVTVTPTGDPAANYARKVLFMQFTSVGCINCPTMSSSLKTVQSERPGRIAAASFHLQYDPNYPDPMWLRINDTYSQKFSVTGLPTGFLNLDPESRMTSDKSSMDKQIDAALAEGNATCGVAIVSTYDDSAREVKIEAKFNSAVTEAYRYLILLVEDAIPYFQLGSDEAEYRHNNVVRAVLSSNIYGERLNQGQALQPGVEVTTNRTAKLGDDWDHRNMRVIVAAMASSDDGVTFTCRNANECALGGSADYQLNE